MSDPWDEAPLETDPWDEAPTVDEAFPVASKSEQTLRDLSIFGGRFDPVGAGETALGVTSGIYDMISTGVAGTFGLVGGMWPGGESPSEKANRYMDRSRGFYQYEPRTQGGEAGMNMVADAGKGIETGVKFIGSGYAAMAGGPEAQRHFMEQENALGEGVFQVTGSPTMATVAQILPEVASMGVPLKKPRPRPSETPVRPEMDIADLPEGYGGVGDVADVPVGRTVPETGPGGRPLQATESDFNALRDALKKGDRERVMELVNANPAIVQAFDELGVEFTPGMVSENQALRQVEQGMQSIPGSGVGEQVGRTKTALQERAQQLIDESGGSSQSPASVAGDIETRYNEIRNDYIAAEDEVWTRLRDVVPRGTRVDARSAAERIMREAELAGGGDIDRGLRSLRQHERRLFDMTHRKVELEDGTIEWQYEEPTYAAVNRFREDLGNSMRQGKPFADADSGQLDLMYGEMAGVQGRVAQGSGYADDWARANTLTQERKALEQAMQRTLGRGLNQSVITRLKSATDALIRGDVKKWDQLFDDLPVDQRQAAAAQALENVFFTAGKGTKMSETAVANFQRIKRDPQLRDRLLDHLPMESRRTFMNIGEAMTGFYRAMERNLANPSGTATANAVIKAIEDGTVPARLFGGLRTTGEKLPVIGSIVRRAPDAPVSEIKRGRVRAAADLLADPQFHRAIVEYAAGRVDEAMKILRGNSRWEGWTRTLSDQERRMLAAGGIGTLFALQEIE